MFRRIASKADLDRPVARRSDPPPTADRLVAHKVTRRATRMYRRIASIDPLIAREANQDDENVDSLELPTDQSSMNRLTADIWDDAAGVNDPRTICPTSLDYGDARRRQILADFYCRRRSPESLLDERPIKILAANGDVKADVFLAWLLYRESGSTSYLQIARVVAPVKLWGIMTRQLGNSARYFGELIDETLRMHDARLDLSASEIHASIFDDENMMAILNARGTVLLNMCFHNTPQQLKIVKLAAMAQLINRHVSRPVKAPRHAKDYSILLTKSCAGQSQVFYAATQCILPLIRDDIETLMLEAISDFSEKDKQVQLDYIFDLQRRAQTWKAWFTMQAGYDWSGPPSRQDGIRQGMERWRTHGELILQRFGMEFQNLVKSIGVTGNSDLLMKGSGYMGPLPANMDNLLRSYDELKLPWIKRRSTGRWFYNPL
ncbi:hypothetical protein N0V83_005991 [Neocucurbitaria cava]|uniref:Uncharacterized protein n=1 Tax=Neocucurbitaria cava TaxID=798079 RepID=A0A9W9CKT5_9PLEO|nr:hypothetical protein N0V83_005991 [Neocucurbitaria cava]